MPSALPLPTDCCQTCCTVTSVISFQSAFGVFDTIAALRGDTTYFNRKMGFVLGGAAYADFDGGDYWFDSTYTAADNGISVIRPNNILAAAAGRWRRQV